MQAPIALKQIVAFTKRDMFSWATYRTAAVVSIINVFVGVFSWGIGASFVQRPVTEMYGTDFISFLVVGVAISNLLLPLVQGVQQLNPWTLETILMTGVNTTVFVIGNMMWMYLFSLITFVPYLLIGIFFFGAHLNANIIAVVIAFVISAAILMGLAMVSTGFRIVTKSTDPITWVLNTLQSLFAGVSFPVIYLDMILFQGASTISWFLPQTWVYHLCRLTMLTNPSLLDPMLWLNFAIGAVFAAVLFPAGYKIFKWGVDKSKKEGTLGWF
jgi:ABC-2 type transport system permease protein